MPEFCSISKVTEINATRVYQRKENKDHEKTHRGRKNIKAGLVISIEKWPYYKKDTANWTSSLADVHIYAIRYLCTHFRGREYFPITKKIYAERFRNVSTAK